MLQMNCQMPTKIVGLPDIIHYRVIYERHAGNYIMKIASDGHMITNDSNEFSLS